MIKDQEIELFLLKEFSLTDLRNYAYFQDSVDSAYFDNPKQIPKIKKQLFNKNTLLNFDAKIKNVDGIEVIEFESASIEKIEHKFMNFLNKRVLEDKKNLKVKTFIFPLVVFFFTVTLTLIFTSYLLENRLVFSTLLALSPLVLYFSFKRTIKNLYLDRFDEVSSIYSNMSLNKHIVNILLKYSK
ncbi:hypothetical protein [Poseidonibacter ostreae]|uniref:Uncharacterized protein n=1 Tax=Poseidonibacter ostreae TaxID=2654171 RepID=A0A6L4WWP0_9BACT|nr:hypothetical protein [Poseidonibacter ostreae]KAB7891301.1 hypothetical protein GBG19_00260 [Poseidonibacter ostreae]